MKLRVSLFLGLVAALGCGAQEMGLSITTPNTVYLSGEPIVANVRVHNRTTRAFQSNKEDAGAQLMLQVTRGDDLTPLIPLEAHAHVADITLPSGHVWAGKVEVSRFFDVREQGRYLVRIIVVHDDMRYESFPRAFDIVPGFEITKVTQVFPGNPPTQRQLRLAYWIRNQMEELFLQVSETPMTRRWRTYSLGAVVRTTAPKVDISPDGLLTIVHRATPEIFVKSQVRSEAQMVTYLGQEKLLDPVASSSKRMVPFHTMAMEDALKKRDEESEKRSWWPFGSKKSK